MTDPHGTRPQRPGVGKDRRDRTPDLPRAPTTAPTASASFTSPRTEP
ncbi:hypothetical protein BN2537_5483 [Streptomyces venezuelae]|nr:hypothetical protein BN2537_5483 [Streptomyces venezuelae]